MYRIMPALFLGLSAASASTAADPHQLDKTHADLLFSISGSLKRTDFGI